MKNRLFFYEQMASLLGAGFDIGKSLDLIISRTSGRDKSALKAVRAAINSGASLSEAMETGGGVLPRFDLALIGSGELTGRLPENLKDLAGGIRKFSGLKRKFLTKLIYPLLLFHAAVLLPPAGHLVLGSARDYFFAVYMPLAVFYFALFALFLLRKFSSSCPAINSFLEKALHAVPWIGKAAHGIAASRFLSSLAIALKSGIVADKALHLAVGAASARIQKAFSKIAPEMLYAEGISAVITESRMISEQYASLIASGETGGSVEDSLLSVSGILESEAETIIERATVIVPLLVYLFAALYTAYIILSFYGELFGTIYAF